MLNREDFDMWLEPSLTNTDPFQDLLETRIRQPLLLELIESPVTHECLQVLQRIEQG